MTNKTILPEGTIIQENSTHVATRIGISDKIKIYTKGFILDEGEEDEIKLKPEYLYSILADDEDDLFSIFEQFDENNRINVAEMNQAMSSI